MHTDVFELFPLYMFDRTAPLLEDNKECVINDIEVGRVLNLTSYWSSFPRVGSSKELLEVSPGNVSCEEEI